MIFHVTGRIDDPSLVPPLVEDEKKASQDLQDEGFTIAAYRRADHPGVYMIVRADDRESAERTIQERLPFVSGRAMTVELVEVLPA